MDMRENTCINRLKRLRTLNNENPNFINLDLYKLLLKDDMLKIGFLQIKTDKNLKTLQKRNQSLNISGKNKLHKLREKLQKET
jgi:hypothetical protein